MKQNLKNSTLAIPVLILSCLLASSASALAESDIAFSPQDRQCSNRTLSGDYGFAGEGLVITGPPQPLPFSTVGISHFDGKGNLSQLEHTLVAGQLQGTEWTMATGTYTVNPNCTGTAVINTPNSPIPLNLAFVVVKQGKEVRTVGDGHAINSVLIRTE